MLHVIWVVLEACLAVFGATVLVIGALAMVSHYESEDE